MKGTVQGKEDTTVNTKSLHLIDLRFLHECIYMIGRSNTHTLNTYLHTYTLHTHGHNIKIVIIHKYV